MVDDGLNPSTHKGMRLEFAKKNHFKDKKSTRFPFPFFKKLHSWNKITVSYLLANFDLGRLMGGAVEELLFEWNAAGEKGKEKRRVFFSRLQERGEKKKKKTLFATLEEKHS